MTISPCPLAGVRARRWPTCAQILGDKKPALGGLLRPAGMPAKAPAELPTFHYATVKNEQSFV
jgi:hypothetical protein